MELLHFGNEIEHKILVTYVIAKVSICSVGYARENMKGRLKPVRRLSDDLSFTKTTRGQSPRYG